MPRTIQTETKRHIEAFDYYYALGEGRSYSQVGDKFGVSNTSVENWCRSFNWHERVKIRDIDNGRKLMEKTDREVVNAKADYRKMIRERLKELPERRKEKRTERSYLSNAFGTAKKKLEDKDDHSLDIKSLKDLAEVAKAISDLDKAERDILKEEQNLIKLDLLLMGEADSHQKHSGEIAFFFGNKITEDDI